MSAAYDAAVKHLRAADDLEAILESGDAVHGVDGIVEGIKVALQRAKVHATLALVDEVEAAVELLRGRFVEPLAFPDGPRVYKPATCTCAVARHDVRAYPAPDEWREGCPAHPERPA